MPRASPRCPSRSWSSELEQWGSPLPRSWAAAARSPPAPRHALTASPPLPPGLFTVPFIEKLLHKALLNCLELGTRVPMKYLPSTGYWENLLKAIRCGPLAVLPWGAERSFPEVGRVQCLSPSENVHTHTRTARNLTPGCPYHEMVWLWTSELKPDSPVKQKPRIWAPPPSVHLGNLCP